MDVPPPADRQRGEKTRARLKPRRMAKTVAPAPHPSLETRPPSPTQAGHGAVSVPAYAYDPLAEPGLPAAVVASDGVLDMAVLLLQWRQGQVIPAAQLDLLEALVLGQSPLALEDAHALAQSQALAAQTRGVFDVHTQAQAEVFLGHGGVLALQAQGLIPAGTCLLSVRAVADAQMEDALAAVAAASPSHLPPRPPGADARLPSLEQWRQSRAELSDPEARPAAGLGFTTPEG